MIQSLPSNPLAAATHILGNFASFESKNVSTQHSITCFPVQVDKHALALLILEC